MKITRLFFAELLLILFMFSSCGSSVTHENTSPESLTPNYPEVPSISWTDLSEYTLIRPEDASETVISSASALYKDLREINPEFSFRDDYYREDLPQYAMQDCEILIGETNRPESIEFINTLRTKDYGYVMQGQKIIISGQNDEYTAKAVELFMREIVQRDNTDGIFYSSEDDLLKSGSYPLESLSVSKNSEETLIQNFTIIYPEKDESFESFCAELLASAIADVTGYSLEIISDSSEQRPYELLIGNTNRSYTELNLADNESCVTVKWDTIQFSGNTQAALLNAVREFSEIIQPHNAEHLTLAENRTYRFQFDTTALTAMSFNILCSKMDNDRIERVIQMITNYMPDTFGVQEATPQWIKLLDREFGDLYEYVGEGRDGGNSGEYSAIFYNKTKFTVMESGTKWLSDTPDKVSKVPESSLNRIFTYALLRRMSDDKDIMFVNTHFEHTSDKARERQAVVLQNFLLEYTDDYPLVLTGDFNTTYSSKAFDLVQQGNVSDSMTLSETTYPGPTFTNFGTANSIIDFIFVTPDTITVNDYRVCDEKINGNFPSDHHPVLIEYIPIG